MLAETADATRESTRGEARPRPGVIVAFSGASAMSLVLAVDDEPLVIGRAGHALLPDDRLSRNHCSIAASAAGWTVRDLGSRNGTFVDGEEVRGEITAPSPRIIRAADTIMVPCADVSTFLPTTTEDGVVVGWASNASYPIGIAVNTTTIFFTTNAGSASNDLVLSMPLAGSASPKVLSSAESVPWSIAVDGTNAYWTSNNATGGAVTSIPLGGGTPLRSITNASNPTGLAVDAVGVYYAASGGGRVWRLTPP
jgi:hypothetical protein